MGFATLSSKLLRVPILENPWLPYLQFVCTFLYGKWIGRPFPWQHANSHTYATREISSIAIGGAFFPFQNLHQISCKKEKIKVKII